MYGPSVSDSLRAFTLVGRSSTVGLSDTLSDLTVCTDTGLVGTFFTTQATDLNPLPSYAVSSVVRTVRYSLAMRAGTLLPVTPARNTRELRRLSPGVFTPRDLAASLTSGWTSWLLPTTGTDLYMPAPRAGRALTKHTHQRFVLLMLLHDVVERLTAFKDFYISRGEMRWLLDHALLGTRRPA